MSCSASTTSTTNNNNNNNSQTPTSSQSYTEDSSSSSTSSTSSYYSDNYLYQYLNMASNANTTTTTTTTVPTTSSSEEPELKKVKLTHYQLSNQFLLPEGLKSSQQSQNLSSNNSMYLTLHRKLEERIGNILCCTVCLDLPQSVIYQCSNGHLMCSGCFSHLLADARLKDEQATCPNCRCEINKSLCSRNLAVEKTLCELPASCSYCNIMYPRNCIDFHQSNECLERPVKCVYDRIGCTWEGPFHELDSHRQQCIHPNRPAKEIISFLNEKDNRTNESHQSLVQLVGLLSVDKLNFLDLQLKQYKTDDITPKLYFETTRFNVFGHQWVIKARINDNEKNPNLSLNRYISYQLILKSKLGNSPSNLEVKFCVLKGPNGECAISPCVHSFEFTQSKFETEYIKFNISSSDCNKLLGSKTINFRFFMFQP